jgi:hypothetical protein
LQLLDFLPDILHNYPSSQVFLFRFTLRTRASQGIS